MAAILARVCHPSIPAADAEPTGTSTTPWRWLVAASMVLLCACTTTPPTEPPKAHAAVILFAGTVRSLGPLRAAQRDPAAPLGFRAAGLADWLNDEPSTLVPAKLGVTFGVMCGWTTGSSAPRAHSVIWRFPAPGIFNAKSGKLWTEYREERRDAGCANPYSCGAIWSIDVPAEAVPGVWSVEIAEPTGKSVSRSFLVTEALTN